MSDLTVEEVVAEVKRILRAKGKIDRNDPRCPLRRVSALACAARYDMNTDTLSNCGCARCVARDEGHRFENCPVCTGSPSTQQGTA